MIFRRGTVWQANFQVNGRQRRESLQTSNKKEARRRAVQLEGELDAGRWQPTVESTTLTEAIDAYMAFLKAEDRAPKTLSKYKKVFERVSELAVRRGVVYLSAVNQRLVDAYRRERADEGIGAKTRFTETVVIRQLVNFALAREMIVIDPLKGLRIKRPKPTLQPCWTPEQTQQILAASPAHVQPALTILAECGLRVGELAWLTWDDVDLIANFLHVRPKPGWKPKSGEQRAVPLSPMLRVLLNSLPRQFRWVVTMPGTTQHAKPGRQWTERRLLIALKKVLSSVGLNGKLHTFRHSFISRALLSGIPVAVVQEWVGHVDPTIIRLYTHVHCEASQAAMARLSALGMAAENRPSC